MDRKQERQTEGDKGGFKMRYYTKVNAQAIAYKLSGLEMIMNNIFVKPLLCIWKFASLV